uniref:Cytochrome b6/f complex subunit VI n=1 Tax=Synura uvella TaxID=52557 RepID=A0A3G2QZ42_9STRA|nr:cytochrome b6/f complex subunit VI [Synura uvella]AYO28400.1 cytochrome b6/f complex subunit VI [Synura uvella]
MTLVLDYLILCGFMFGLVTALYIGLKTIKLI